jgi:hypothetical protein
MIDKLRDFLDSEEGKKSMDEYFEKLQREELHLQRWVDRVWNRIKDDIDGSIEHLLNWYESDKYRDREYKMGFEPREQLLWVLLDVAQKHGRLCTEKEVEIYANMFTGGMYGLGSYIIQVMNGQGSVVRIDKIK